MNRSESGKLRALARRIARPIARFVRARDGLAATEFALIAPVMMSIYFGVTELSDGLMAHTKMTSVASTAADLVAQDTTITNAEVSDIFNALNAIMFPYPADNTKIVISSVIPVGNSGKGMVRWSDAQNTTARQKNSIIDVPPGLISGGGSVIMAEVTYTYTSPAGELIYGQVPFSDTFYSRPRRVIEVARTN